MEYIDRLVEESVKEAIEGLVARGERAYSGSVPTEAGRLLMSRGRGRISEAIAAAKVKDAIWRMTERKELNAPVARHNDWVFVNQPSSPSDDDI